MQTQLIIRYDFNGVVYAQGSGFNKNECFIFLLGPGTEVLCFSFFQDVDQPINRISFFFLIVPDCRMGTCTSQKVLSNREYCA